MTNTTHYVCTDEIVAAFPTKQACNNWLKKQPTQSNPANISRYTARRLLVQLKGLGCYKGSKDSIKETIRANSATALTKMSIEAGHGVFCFPPIKI